MLRSTVLAPVGVLVLVAALAACSTSPGGGGGGGNQCTTPTAIHGGTPLTVPAPGWYTADTRSSGNVKVDNSFGAPTGFGCNAVVMTTGSVSGQDKAQLYTFAKAGTAFSDVANVSYWSYRAAAPVGSPADVALNIQLFGTAGFTPGCTVTPGLGCFTTLVYEPYFQSGGNAGVVDNTWQHWDATATSPGDGMWWSSKILSGQGSQSDPQPMTFFKGLYTDATLSGYGFNIGSSNPNMVVAADGLAFEGVTTDF
jgi:hypothetical protein